MKKITKEMVEIFKTYKYDWMNYLIENNDITYHHIIKVEDGGQYTVDNGALLTNGAHIYLHNIERHDKKLYDEINEVFKEINKNRKISYYQRNKIQLLLLKYELKNVDKIIKRKEKLGKHRTLIAVMRRIKQQELL